MVRFASRSERRRDNASRPAARAVRNATAPKSSGDRKRRPVRKITLQAIREAADRFDLTHRERDTLEVMVEHADRSGCTFVSESTIAECLRIKDTRTARRWRKELEKKGAIRDTGERQRAPRAGRSCTVWQINLPPEVFGSAPVTDRVTGAPRPCHNRGIAPLQKSTQKSTGRAASSRPAPGAEREPVEQQPSPDLRSGRAADYEALPDAELRELHDLGDNQATDEILRRSGVGAEPQEVSDVA